VLLEPQPLAQHFTQGVDDRAVFVFAGDRLDFRPGSAQPGFQGVGGVQQAAHGPLAAAATPAREEDEGGRRDHRGQGEQQGGGHAAFQGRLPASLPSYSLPDQAAKRSGGLTRPGPLPNIPRLMSAPLKQHGLPEQLDAWRMVAARRTFDGVLPLSSMARLQGSLADTQGDARVEIEFDTDALRIPYIELRIEAKLPLECQRSLQRFAYPVRIVQRLGLIRDEAGEEALPEGYEALLVGDDGMMRPADLVEDELILAVPVVPVAPGTDEVERDWDPPEEETQRANPFSVLSSLKDKKS
jgi:uncharacterized protein